jgi:MFS family permease
MEISRGQRPRSNALEYRALKGRRKFLLICNICGARFTDTMNSEATDDGPGIKALWPIFLVAVVLLLLSCGCFFFAVKTWVVIALACLGFAFLCYGFVFCFCPPQPLISKRSPSEVPRKQAGRPPAVSEVPIMVVGMLFMALISPWLLTFALLFKFIVWIQWRRQFPNSSKAEIRDFLNALARSLGFESAKHRLLSPNDKLLSIYESIYGPGSTPDNTEIDHFIRHMQERYGIDVLTSWREDVTVGELYARAKNIFR